MIILFFSLLIFYSIYNIVNHAKDSNNINKNLEMINKNINKDAKLSIRNLDLYYGQQEFDKSEKEGGQPGKI